MLFRILVEKNSKFNKKNIWISSIDVWSYGPLASINFNNFKPGLILIYGPNEAGKTLLLESILKSILELSSDFKKEDRIEEDPNSKIVIHKKHEENLEIYNFPEKRNIFDEVMEIELKNQPLDRIFRNTFIIRNSDYDISEKKGYFSTLSNIVMGWDYDDLNDVKAKIRNLGRLTKKSSSKKSILINVANNKIKTLKKDAIDLSSEISNYIEIYREEEYEKYEIKILEAKKLIKDHKKRVEFLKNIEGKSKYKKSKGYLDKYIKTLQDLEPLLEFSDNLSNKLKSINNNIDDFKSRINELETKNSKDNDELKQTQLKKEQLNQNFEITKKKKTNFEIIG